MEDVSEILDGKLFMEWDEEVFLPICESETSDGDGLHFVL